MKKIMFSAAVLAGMLSAVPAQAQTSASADATVTLQVLAPLTLTKNSDLDLGTTTQGNNATVAATAAAAAKFTAGGEASTAITLTFPATATLANGGNNLSFAPAMNSNAADDQAASTARASGDVVTLSNTGFHYFWMGGTATVAANQATGTYTGTVTVTVAY